MIEWLKGIDPRAVVHPGAQLGERVTVAPFAIVGPEATIGDDCWIGPHAIVDGRTVLGRGNIVGPYCTIGVRPQDLKYKGEPSELVVGDHNTFRESCTIHRGSEHGGNVTRIGSHGLFMVGTHIAHDCQVGNGVLFVNGATLGGHIEVGDYATVGAFSGVHQFCRVGPHAFIGGYSVITRDAMPFCTTVGNRAHCYGVNKIGLVRKGYAKELIETLDQAVRRIFSPQLRREQALAEVDARWGQIPEVRQLVEFVRSSPRGVIPIRFGESAEG